MQMIFQSQKLKLDLYLNEINDLNSKCFDYSSKIRECEKNLQSSMFDNESKNQIIKEMDERMEEMHERMKETHERMEEMRNSYESKIDRLSKESSSEISSLKMENINQKAEICYLKYCLDECSKMTEEAKKEKATLVQRIATYKYLEDLYAEKMISDNIEEEALMFECVVDKISLLEKELKESKEENERLRTELEKSENSPNEIRQKLKFPDTKDNNSYSTQSRFDRKSRSNIGINNLIKNSLAPMNINNTYINSNTTNSNMSSTSRRIFTNPNTIRNIPKKIIIDSKDKSSVIPNNKTNKNNI